ncbi:MAG: STAS domain-containing protein [Brevinematales bacterium]|nr:STAS domain-containing protein [Brevinematales bacterium]
MAGVEISIKMDGQIGIIAVAGSVDAHTVGDFDKKLKEVLAKTKSIIIDVASLEYIATAGLGALMASFNEVKKGGGNIILAGMSDKVKKVFDTMGFSKVFKIVGSVPEAKSAL